jgi:hypothetical protein
MDTLFLLVQMEDEEENRLKMTDNGVYKISVNSQETIKMQFSFNPTGVATYRYQLPIAVNRPPANSNPKREPSSRETSALPDSNSIITRSSKRIYNGPQVNVMAIGLRYALHLTNTNISFNVPLSNLAMMECGGYCESEVICKVFC